MDWYLQQLKNCLRNLEFILSKGKQEVILKEHLLN